MQISKQQIETIENKYFGNNELRGWYTVSQFLGQGSYGAVCEGVSLVDYGYLRKNDKVAIKKVRRVFETETDALRLLREMRILRLLSDHSAIVTLYDIIPPNDCNHFTTMFCFSFFYFYFLFLYTKKHKTQKKI